MQKKALSKRKAQAEQRITLEWNLNNDDLIKKAYNQFENSYTKETKEARELRDAEAKLRKIRIKLENLTEMRVNGEIDKQE